jgi:hypothetical protein
VAWCHFGQDVLKAVANAFESLLANTRKAWRGGVFVLRVHYCGVMCVGRNGVVAASAKVCCVWWVLAKEGCAGAQGDQRRKR